VPIQQVPDSICQRFEPPHFSLTESIDYCEVTERRLFDSDLRGIVLP
jgi:hypothetical protein